MKGADSNTNWSEFDGGDNVMTNIDKSGNVRVGIKKNLKVESVTANKFTAGDTVIDSNGVTIKNGPSMTKMVLMQVINKLPMLHQDVLRQTVLML